MEPVRIVTLLRNLAVPRACLGCGRAHHWWCPACATLVAETVPVRSGGLGFPVVAGCRYEGVARGLLLGFKEGLVTDVAPELAALLARGLALFPTGPLVPVPSTRRARIRRGFEPVHEILRHQDRRVARVLRWERVPSQQKQLGRSARIANLSHAMVADRVVKGAVLVDDVLTTGATLAEAARAVRAAGGTITGAAVVARAPLAGEGAATIRVAEERTT